MVNDLPVMARHRLPSVSRRLLEVRIKKDEHKHLRKAEPANVVLPRTKEWADALPPQVRPNALMNRYARIANLLAASWGYPRLSDTYMESLLIDNRGGRRGFPPEILAELRALGLFRLRSRVGRFHKGSNKPASALG